MPTQHPLQTLITTFHKHYSTSIAHANALTSLYSQLEAAQYYLKSPLPSSLVEFPDLPSRLIKTIEGKVTQHIEICQNCLQDMKTIIKKMMNIRTDIIRKVNLEGIKLPSSFNHTTTRIADGIDTLVHMYKREVDLLDILIGEMEKGDCSRWDKMEYIDAKVEKDIIDTFNDLNCE